MKKIVILLCFVVTIFLMTSTVHSAEKVFYYHNDAAGTPMAITDSSGNVVWRANYKPFGEVHSITGTLENNKQFIGKNKDAETGLIYFDQRYMKPETGIFNSPDPLSPVDPWTSKTNVWLLHNPQLLNKYSYSANNPYRYKDPNGREVIAIEPQRVQEFLRIRQQVLGWAPSWMQEIMMPADISIGPMAIESAGPSMAATIGQGLKNIRTIGTGRLKGFLRGNTELPGGEQGARELFQKLAGKEPSGAFDRAVLEDSREVVFRATSKSEKPKIEVVDHTKKFFEKITFTE